MASIEKRKKSYDRYKVDKSILDTVPKGGKDKKSYLYRQPRYIIVGKGAYYLKGSAAARGKLPYVGNFDASLSGGVGSNDRLISGMGTYNLQNIKHNVLITPQIPTIRNSKREGAHTIRHKEYIAPVISSGTVGQFKIDRYVINPANRLLFPWLHRIAMQYEQYCIDGCVIEFRSTTSDTNINSLQLGSLLMATNYDPNDPPYLNIQSIMAARGSSQSKVSNNNMFFLECDPRQRPTELLYVRADTDSNKTNDARLSDHGIFYIASQGVSTANQQLGELYISYQISFFNPKLGALSPSEGAFFHVYQDAGISAVSPLGVLNTVEYDGLNTLPVVLSSALNSVRFTLPQTNDRRTYSIEAISYMTSSNAEAYQIQNLLNNTVVEFFDDETKLNIRIPSSAGVTTRSYMKYIITTDGNGTVPTFDLACGVVGISPLTDVIITELPFMDPSLY